MNYSSECPFITMSIDCETQFNTKCTSESYMRMRYRPDVASLLLHSFYFTLEIALHCETISHSPWQLYEPEI
jgi:hypothetical protein